MGNVTILPPPKKEPKQRKLTQKEEAFAQGVAAGQKKIDAFLAAGYVDNCKGRASEEPARLSHRPIVAARIKQLQAQHARRLNVTLNSLLLELEEARLVAQLDLNPAAMVAATMSKAKLLGMLDQMGDSQGKIGKPLAHPSDVKELTLEEWEERFKPKIPPTLQ